MFGPEAMDRLTAAGQQVLTTLDRFTFEVTRYGETDPHDGNVRLILDGARDVYSLEGLWGDACTAIKVAEQLVSDMTENSRPDRDRPSMLLPSDLMPFVNALQSAKHGLHGQDGLPKSHKLMDRGEHHKYWDRVIQDRFSENFTGAESPYPSRRVRVDMLRNAIEALKLCATPSVAPASILQTNDSGGGATAIEIPTGNGAKPEAAGKPEPIILSKVADLLIHDGLIVSGAPMEEVRQWLESRECRAFTRGEWKAAFGDPGKVGRGNVRLYDLAEVTAAIVKAKLSAPAEA